MKPLDKFIPAHPYAVKMARKGDVRDAVRLYAHGGAYCHPYLSTENIENRATWAATDAQGRSSLSPAAMQHMKECDDFVLLTRDLPMPDKIRWAYGQFIEEWRADWRLRFGVYAEVHKRRRHALNAWEFAKACRKEGLLPCPPTPNPIPLP